jgi:hypothetical protein
MQRETPAMMKKAAEENEEVRKWLEMVFAMREISLQREAE